MLIVKDLHKSFKNNHVLKGIDFSVKSGEIKALIGENGAGKSTLIEIICGVKKCDKGEVFISNINTQNRKKIKEIKKTVGYMPQSFTLYQDLTVRENISYVCAVYGINEKDKINDIIKLCYLDDVKDRVAGNLSGGYKQLLTMACAIIHAPKFLILDEPTSAMDPIFRKKFWNIIRSINKEGTTILIITHYLEELLECDTFACLSNGRISYDGRVEEFKKSNFINIEEILKKFGAKP